MRHLASPFFWTKSFLFVGVGYFLYSCFFGRTNIHEESSQKAEFFKVEDVIERPNVEINRLEERPLTDSGSKDSDFGTDFATANSNLICSGENEKKCAAPLKRYRSIIYTVPKYRISACTIYKNMSSMLRAIMCYLFNPEFSNKYKPNFTDYYKADNCWSGFTDMFYGYKQVLKAYPDFVSANWTMLALVRDPIEKFVSGFVDKCVRSRACKHCNTDIYCFIKEQYKEIIESSYNLSGLRHSYVNDHFFPQNWQCDMSTYYRNYTFIKFSSDPETIPKFYQKIADLLTSRKIEDKIVAEILEHLEKERSQNTNSGRLLLDSLAKGYMLKIKSNPKLMEYMIRMYYHDFRLFGYEIPGLRNK
ncbi:hypothetical protein FO519_001014 [Halicephalobus sp. NKZ332]|nr:hypothetical protein FO519_001014 [Halicephalobus sp. NKZ332]